jgi:hypothetical protein
MTAMVPEQKRVWRVILPIATFLVLSVPIPAVGVTKIMPLGDSITRGWTGSANRWGYRRPLYVSLTNGGYEFDFVGSIADGNFPDPNHEGHDGWRADEILNGRPSEPNAGKLVDWLSAHQPDVVLLHIGTNDITAGNEDANEVNDILDVIDDYEAQSNKRVTVILALIINRRTYNPATTEYNNEVEAMAISRIAGGDDIIIVDMEGALNYSTDMYDDTHPNDNGYAKIADVWYNAMVQYFDNLRDRIEEIHQRLELRTSGRLTEFAAFYNANGWSFDTTKDFAMKVDFHYGDISAAEGWIGMTVGDDANYVSISTGSDSNASYFYYEAVVDGNMVFEQEPRASDDGTLYIWYDAALKEFYVSRTGFGSENAYAWSAPNPTRGQWGSPVKVSVGGGSSGADVGPGEAYLDNFKVNTAVLLDWPPATDLNENGFIEIYDLAIMCENWLGAGEGDVDNNGVVDFFDYAEFGLAW